LGGIAIFAGATFSFAFWSATYKFVPGQYIIAAVIIMFFIGLKDDIITLTPSKKFIAQLIASLIIVLIGNIRISSLCGVFGIYALPYFASVLFSIITIIGITNSFNLMDGIDGLAGGVGAIAAFTFGLWFYNYNEIPLCILSFSLFGALLAFLVYNFSPAKIFMGDTGSLIVGLILSILAIYFVQLSFFATPYSFPFRSSPAMAISILIIPLFDTIRIFIWRIYNKRSPFQADRNHMHHILLDLGLNHRQASLLLYSINIAFILVALALRNISSLVLLIVIISLAILLSLIPLLMRHFKFRTKITHSPAASLDTKTAI
jgi:UDP-N-acetylmuramyl pentapeptide phosphotransferase/UDP-N-acetylglucosamine-1-phosphate transferase